MLLLNNYPCCFFSSNFRLVEKFFELQENGELSDEETFNAAIDSLKNEGLRLRTLAEKVIPDNVKDLANTYVSL